MPFWLLLMLRMSDIWARAPGGHYANERQQRERERERSPFIPSPSLPLSFSVCRVSFTYRCSSQFSSKDDALRNIVHDRHCDGNSGWLNVTMMTMTTTTTTTHALELYTRRHPLRYCTWPSVCAPCRVPPFFFLCSCFLPFKPKVSESNNPVNKRTV